MAMQSPDQGMQGVDEVRIVAVDDGDPALVNVLLKEGWRLLACGVTENRRVGLGGDVTSIVRCTFILGRNGAEHLMAEATAIVEAVEAPLEEEANASGDM